MFSLFNIMKLKPIEPFLISWYKVFKSNVTEVDIKNLQLEKAH